MPSRIWFDATTIQRLRRHAPVGLSRVEANVLRGAMHLPLSQARFCSFDRYSRRIQALNRTDVEQLLERYGDSGTSAIGQARKTRSPIRNLGKLIERNTRLTLRRSLLAAKKTLGIEKRFPDWSPGDAFVLSGSTWDSIDAPTLESIAVECGLNLAIVINDMIPVLFPHHFSDLKAVESFATFAECTARHAALTLCISESTKADFERFAASKSIVPKSTQVIRLGDECVCSMTGRPQELPRNFENQGFVVSVSTIQVRKNYQLLYQLWRRFAEEGRTDIPRLVIAGSAGWMTNDLRHQLQNDPLIKDKIVVLNHASDSELSWLYQHCRFSLYPSIYEGWGLPIVESLRYGKPCIASNTSSMPEAGQGIAVHLDPYDFRQWYDAIVAWSTDHQLITQATRRIEDHYQHRSWDAFGQDFCNRVLSIGHQQTFAKAA